jgi:hypothetical protein
VQRDPRYQQDDKHGHAESCGTPDGPFGVRLSRVAPRSANVRQQTERHESHTDHEGPLIALGAASSAALACLRLVSRIFDVREERS